LRLTGADQPAPLQRLEHAWGHVQLPAKVCLGLCRLRPRSEIIEHSLLPLAETRWWCGSELERRKRPSADGAEACRRAAKPVLLVEPAPGAKLADQGRERLAWQPALQLGHLDLAATIVQQPSQPDRGFARRLAPPGQRCLIIRPRGRWAEDALHRH